MQRTWDAATGGQTAPQDMRWLPMFRLAQAVAQRLQSAPADSGNKPADQYPMIYSDAHLSAAEKDAIFEYVVKRYADNMRVARAICREFKVRCLFVWHPHPAYKYDRALHKHFPFENAIPAHHERVYAHMENFKAPDFLFLGDLTATATQKVYVDDVHYNEATNEKIASNISAAIEAN